MPVSREKTARPRSSARGSLVTRFIFVTFPSMFNQQTFGLTGRILRCRPIDNHHLTPAVFLVPVLMPSVLWILSEPYLELPNVSYVGPQGHVQGRANLILCASPRTRREEGIGVSAGRVLRDGRRRRDGGRGDAGGTVSARRHGCRHRSLLSSPRFRRKCRRGP